MLKISVIILLLFGCNYSKINISNKDIKVIKINKNKDISTIYSINKDLNKINSLAINNTKLSLINSSPLIINNNLYDISTTKLHNKLTMINLNNKKTKVISPAFLHPVVQYYHQSNFYYSSNFVHNNSLVKYNVNSKKNTIIKHNNYFFNQFVHHKNSLYAFVSRIDNDSEYLLKLDLKTLKIVHKTKLLHSNYITTQALYHDGRIIYISNSNKLIFYDINKNAFNFKKLNLDYPAKLNINNNKLYINNADKLTFNSTKPQIEIIDLTTNKSIIKNFSKTIFDYLILDNNIYFLSNDTISKYSLTNLKFITDITLSKKSDELYFKLFY